MNAEELLKKLEAERDAYQATFQQLQEVLAKNSNTSDSLAKTTIASDSSSLPSSTYVTQNLSPVLDRIARLSMSEGERKPIGLINRSFISNEDDELSDDDEALYVQDLLPTYHFVDEDLRDHIKKYRWNRESRKILESLFGEGGRMRHPNLFPSSQSPDEDPSHVSFYQVFDIGTDGAPIPLHIDGALMKAPSGQTMWNYIKDINADPARRQAVGRITILREPSATLFAAAHLTFNELLNMDEIYARLVQQGTTTSDMTRAFSHDQRQQRSFVFSFEYFTVIGERCEPMAWQLADQEREFKDDHIPISRCSATVALSLVGEPIRKLKNSARRAVTQHGFVYDPWSPWHVLNIQCYPDWKSDTESHDSAKHYVNGPDAFLNTLLVEYKDAQKRFEEISSRVTNLVTPPPEFMFKGSIRDKLLFEDSDFTNSRRYFWAFQTLGTMNQSIRAMIDAYKDTFTKDVWEGRHKTLWPLVDPSSARNEYWKKRMALLKKDFESEIDALGTIVIENDNRRKEIKNLRDNLFSGTSVLESRKSVEQTEITVAQGHNIKLLTLVNMFFLPLTFVTSVFGMTNMPQDADFMRFGIVMATVCVPFFLLIGSMNTSVGMRFWTEQFGAFWSYTGRLFGRAEKPTPAGRRRASVSSTISNEMVPGSGRSLSAREGLARRTGMAPATEKSVLDHNSGSGKGIPPNYPRPIQQESGPRSSHIDPLGNVKDEKGKRLITQPQATLDLSASSSMQTVPPALTATSSTAVLTEKPDPLEESPPQAAFQKANQGLWDRFRSGKPKNGGMENTV